MKRILLTVAGVIIVVALIGHCAQAQQADPKLETYKFLLSEANGRVVDANAQISALAAENAQLKAQIEKSKKEAEPPKDAPKQ